MPTVEIRIASAHVVARMDEVRRWLRERGCAHRLTSTGSRDERVVLVEFISGADAAEFAQYFGGSLVIKQLAASASNRLRLRQLINCANVPVAECLAPAPFSDDDLLATISVLAGDASDVSVRKALTERLGQEIGLAYVRERLRRLDAAHLVSFAWRLAPAVAGKSTNSVRLTAAGVEHLCALQREPLCPEIE